MNVKMNVKIEVIDHKKQRYSTCGDWFFQPTITCTNCYLEIAVGGELPPPITCPVCAKNLNKAKKGELLRIRVSKLSDWRREMLVAFHELAEVLICKHRNISQASVDRFDNQFE